MSDGNEAELYSEKMSSVRPRLYTQIFIQNDSIFTCGQKVLELIGGTWSLTAKQNKNEVCFNVTGSKGSKSNESWWVERGSGSKVNL